MKSLPMMLIWESAIFSSTLLSKIQILQKLLPLWLLWMDRRESLYRLHLMIAAFKFYNLQTTQPLMQIDISLKPVQKQTTEVHQLLPIQQSSTNVDKQEHKPINGKQAQMLLCMRKHLMSSDK